MRIRRAMPEHSFEAINVTPMIDVVMCLIIFFLLVGKLASDKGVDVDLPASNQGEDAAPKQPIVISIATANGDETGWPGHSRVSVDGENVSDAASLESLVQKCLREHAESTIQIRADRSFTYGVIEPVLAACGRAGATQVRLVTERRDP